MPTEPATPDATASAVPASLDAVERTGATRMGSPVAKLIVVYRDGRRASFDLPEPVVADGTAEGQGDRPPFAMSASQRRIMGVLRDSPEPLTRKVIAARMHLASAKGAFGRSVSELVSAGEILTRGEELTDDASKFVG